MDATTAACLVLYGFAVVWVRCWVVYRVSGRRRCRPSWAPPPKEVTS